MNVKDKVAKALLKMGKPRGKIPRARKNGLERKFRLRVGPRGQPRIDEVK